MSLLDDLFSSPDFLDVFGADFDAGRQLTVGNPVITPIAFVHDPVAGILGQYIQVKAHSGLPLGNFPWTYGPTFGPAHAQILMDSDDPVGERVGGAKRTQIDAGGIQAVHAPAGYGQFERAAVVHPFGVLDEQPVIGRQPVCDVSLFLGGPVFDTNLLGRVHGGHRTFRFRILGIVDVPAGVHTGFAGNAFLNVN